MIIFRKHNGRYTCKVFTKKNGILYYFHSAEHDHQKKHVHVKNTKTNSVIGLDPVVTLVPNKLHPQKQHKEAVDFVTKHQEELLNMWDKTVMTDANTNLLKNKHGTPLSTRIIWLIVPTSHGLQSIALRTKRKSKL